MIEIRCDIVEAGEAENTVLVYGYVDPPPLAPRSAGDLIDLFNDIQKGDITLGFAHCERQDAGKCPQLDKKELQGNPSAPKRAGLPAPVVLVTFDNAGNRTIFTVESVHICELSAGGTLYELLIRGNTHSLRWLTGRNAKLMGRDEI
jgi:hypothetical protein